MYEYILKGSYSDNIYNEEKGFGFYDTGYASSSSLTLAERSLKNGGWFRRDLKEKTDVSDREVLIIKIPVREFGTYQIKLKILALKEPVKKLSIFSMRRTILNNMLSLEPDKAYTRTFFVAVTPYIPAFSYKRCNDKDIFISLTGEGLIKSSGDYGAYNTDNLEISIEIEKKEVPVIYIAGDSTVTDQNAGIPYYPFDSCCGWAQTLPMYIDSAAVCNQSHSGLTSNCFKDDGHYGIILERIKQGDLFIIQFGHNDQKRRNLKAFEGYADNLRRYISDIKGKKADIIICSPISRIPQKNKDGSSYSLLYDYSKAAEAVANEFNIPFINLHSLTFDKWTEIGDKSTDYFMKGDITHTNEYGACLISSLFMREIRKIVSKDPDILINSADNGFTAPFFSPDSDTKIIPEQTAGDDIFSIGLPFIDTVNYPAKEELEEAFHRGLMDPCVMYLHPYAVMPRAQLLMILFKALRISGKRPYKGYYADIHYDEWDSGYIQTLHEENLIDPQTVKKSDSDLYFRPDDPLTYEELFSFLIRFLEKDKEKRDISIKDCVKKAKALGIDTRTDHPELTSKTIGSGKYNIDFEKNISIEETEIEKRYESAQGNYISRGEIYIVLSRFIDIAKDIRKRSIKYEA
ncbi:MAG: hypothetical protein K6B28_09995 [Lachnospiraceae bacterium]|nr:hypothetical protein [Lachnospiraceae bacterium]